MTIMTNTLLAGAAYVLAGIFGLIRHFMLEPKVQAMPRAPTWLLHVFFCFSAVLVYVGLRFLWAWGTNSAMTSPPGATGMGLLMAISLLVYKASLLKDATSQYRLSGEIWRHS